MRFIIIVVLTALVMEFAVPPVAAQDAPAGRGWNRDGAARYLDDRMELWFTNATKLRTGQSEARCVSCHTTVWYALSRPVLRRAMQVTTPTPQEARLIEETTRRVETYGAHQLLFEVDERKKAESRGTEAVLNALTLAGADAGQNRQDPSDATRKAMQWLWKTQRADGAWDWLDLGLEPFESVNTPYQGAALAALAIGIAPGRSTGQSADARIGTERLRNYLKEKYATQNLYNRVWALLASTELTDLLTRSQREALIAEIQNRQRDDGGWSLHALGPWSWSKTAPPFEAPGALDVSLLAKSDGFATGLIVFALREGGLAVDRPTVKRGLQWLGANQQTIQVDQQTWHAWRAHSLNFDREHGADKGESWRRLFMSDAATAFAVLALTAQ